MSDLDISEGLVELARSWQFYSDVTERPCPDRRVYGPDYQCGDTHTTMIKRCAQCTEEIYPEDLIGVLGHLTTTHGFRMDGRQFDNQNMEISRV